MWIFHYVLLFTISFKETQNSPTDISSASNSSTVHFNESDCLNLAYVINNEVTSLAKCMIDSAMDNSYKICTICVRDYLKVLTRERLLSNVVQETKIPCETFLAAKMGTPSIITEHIKFFMMMWDKFKCHDCIDDEFGIPNAITTRDFKAIEMLDECVQNCSFETSTSMRRKTKKARGNVDSILFFASYARCNILHRSLLDTLGNPRKAKNRCFDLTNRYNAVTKKWIDSSCYRDLREHRFSFTAYFVAASLILTIIFVIGYSWHQCKRRSAGKWRFF